MHMVSVLFLVGLLPCSSASISAQAARVWALRNTLSLTDGWRVFSVAFYGDENCSEELVPEAFLDGGHYDVNYINFGADKAFDNKDFTVWVAQCGVQSKTGQPCAPYEAWIGADFGSPVVVYCVRVCQTKGATASDQITLSKEGTGAASDGNLWVDIQTWDRMATTGSAYTCNTRFSGINIDVSIKYAAPLLNTHCFENSYDVLFFTYVEAKSMCDQMAECVGIYDYECSRMLVEVTFIAGEQDKWERFNKTLGSNHALVSDFTDTDGAVIPMGSNIAVKDQGKMSEPRLPLTINMDLPVKGLLRLCRLNTNSRSDEGSCLHLKTGALLEFTLHPNTRGIAEVKLVITVKKVDLCGEACLDMSECDSFLYLHKSQGDDITIDNCNLQGKVKSKEILDGSIEVADLYIKKPKVAVGTTNSTGGNNTQVDSRANQYGLAILLLITSFL
eukprot:GEMP01043807.1.p1 GENE.GEMP01043807.1~~GEMP01043807.1.p1  ORF type:complete len:446 (+),score=39.46 GEMP01043807.1:237-1574(+)